MLPCLCYRFRAPMPAAYRVKDGLKMGSGHKIKSQSNQNQAWRFDSYIFEIVVWVGHHSVGCLCSSTLTKVSAANNEGTKARNTERILSQEWRDTRPGGGDEGQEYGKNTEPGMKGIWLKTEKKEYGNTENTCFTDLSWLLEITVVVPEHLSLFLFACRGYSVHSNLRVHLECFDARNHSKLGLRCYSDAWLEAKL